MALFFLYVDDNDYQPPFRFTGKLDKLTIKLVPPKRTAEEEQLLQQKTQDARKGGAVGPSIDGETRGPLLAGAARGQPREDRPREFPLDSVYLLYVST